MGGGVVAISLSTGGPAYRFPLAAGGLVVATSLIMMARAMRLGNDATEYYLEKTTFPFNAALVALATFLLPVALTMRISFGPVAFLFLWLAIIALHPVKKQGALIGLPIAAFVGFGATMIFRGLLQVDLP